MIDKAIFTSIAISHRSTTNHSFKTEKRQHDDASQLKLG
jgi:hypothetical protein